MSRKKKNKVKKLTEEEYGRYIMALKDEAPPTDFLKAESESKHD